MKRQKHRKNAWLIHQYSNRCEYKGIPIEFNIKEDFISLQK